MQAIAVIRFLGRGRTVIATKEANEYVGTTEIANESRIASGIVDIVVEVIHDTSQYFRIGVVLVL
jgi:hypothetical protein